MRQPRNKWKIACKPARCALQNKPPFLPVHPQLLRRPPLHLHRRLLRHRPPRHRQAPSRQTQTAKLRPAASKPAIPPRCLYADSACLADAPHCCVSASAAAIDSAIPGITFPYLGKRRPVSRLCGVFCLSGGSLFIYNPHLTAPFPHFLLTETVICAIINWISGLTRNAILKEENNHARY